MHVQNTGCQFSQPININIIYVLISQAAFLFHRLMIQFNQLTAIIIDIYNGKQLLEPATQPVGDKRVRASFPFDKSI